MAAPKAGNTVRASNYPKVRFIRKAATESVTSSIVLQNDDDFVVPLEANKTYLVEVELAAAGATAGDIQIAWVASGGAAGLGTRICRGPGVSSTNMEDGTMRSSRHSLSTAKEYGVAATNAAINERFLVETTTSGLPGTVTMQWAQFVSNASATSLTTSSWLLITEVDAF